MEIHDMTALDFVPIEPGAFLRNGSGLHRLPAPLPVHPRQRLLRDPRQTNLDCTRRARREVDRTTGLRSDQTIALAGSKSSRLYPDPLRKIAFYDTDHQRRLVFLTNNFQLPALTIARLYKCRWQIELFFKWIKQHLRIKAFYGTSDNAVKTQVWIAISVYVLVAIVKKELGIDRSLYEILQILSLTLFEKTPLFTALSEHFAPNSETYFPNQPTLFDL